MASRLPAAPPVLSGFQYVRPLGTGGFADVFLFEQDMPRRPVAVKVLLTNIVDDDLLRMFNAEADAMAKLSAHPSILTIYQASISADGRPYLVMEYCPSSFTTRYRREEIPLAEILTLGIKMGSALETAHRVGMLHRDIKPSNILVTQYGTPVLSDFGIATSTGHPAGDDVVAMSVPWSAPEVVEERVGGSVAAEVWSLGATLYTLIAGQSPFEKPGRGMNQREKLKQRIIRAGYTNIDRANIPLRLEAALKKSMTKDPEQRFETIIDFVSELQKVQQELQLAVTSLEVSEETWTPDMLDRGVDEARGLVRSVVPATSKRIPRAKRLDRDPVRADMSVPGSEADSRGVSMKHLIVMIGLTVAITGAGVTLLLWAFGALG